MRVWQFLMIICVVIGMASCVGAEVPQPTATALPTQAFTGTPTFTLAPTNTLSTSSASANNEAADPTGTNTPSPLPTSTATAAPPIPTFDPQAWRDLAVIPTLSPRAEEILRDGLAKGNNPRAFSKIGDCETQASWFLENFDRDAQYYTLGTYEAELSPVIAYYSGSYMRPSLAARKGFTAASLFAPLWSDKVACEKTEGPLACEYRVQRPIVAFILLGTNDAVNPATFEGHMRKIIEYSISQGVLPVLGTKADNVEKDHAINATIARLGMEYEVPVWNFWAAIQGLPNHGLQRDGVHLTVGNLRFDSRSDMKRAWTVRNLNALQILKEVMDKTADQ